MKNKTPEKKRIKSNLSNITQKGVNLLIYLNNDNLMLSIDNKILTY